MALAIDGSTPAIATGSTATLNSSSFTPPANSVLLIEWVGNSHAATNPTTPGITDNLGVHLTYTLIDWQSRNDSPTVDGQAAMWWALVGTSSAMTITTTNNVTGGFGETHQALRITVLTGADTNTPIGAHGKSGSASAASIAQNYTAEATNGWGFIAVADWDALSAMSAGTGCTLDGSAVIPTNQITYGFVRRTSADDTNGNTNTLNVTIGGTSTHLNWAYAEVKPAATTASAIPTPIVSQTTVRSIRPGPPAIIRSTLADPPVLTTQPPLVVTQPAPKPVANQGLTWRNTLQDPPVLTTPAPLVVSQPARFTLPNQAITSRASLQDFATPQPLVVTQPTKPVPGTPPIILRSSLVDVAIVTQATPPPLVVSQPEKPRPGTPPTILRNTLVDPPVLTTPQPIVVSGPVRPVPVVQPTILRSSLQDFATPAPLVVSQPVKPVTTAQPVILRSSLQDLSTPQPLVSVPPAVKPWNAPPVILRSSLADPVVVTGTATPRPLVISFPPAWQWTYRPLVLTGTRCDCITHRPDTGIVTRPDTGTVAYGGSIVTRPNTGVIIRPDTGIVEDPCC